MITINFINSKGIQKSVNAVEGETLMECAKKNDIYEIEADCGGGCSCATCHVYIEKEWINKIKEPSEMEEDMLDFALNVKDNSRLSCQIKLESDLDGLTVRTPETQF
ncbi:MAG: 2Fe-2S iron-sulfur cluster binding domain-containing protein [Rhizobiales bacterium]|jgi:2Fe-2S ferredoxin|nr:2Fe-2S iron-sulfur cluster binding domain-containing protein [Hyphomicrobiales bacterium]